MEKPNGPKTARTNRGKENNHYWNLVNELCQNNATSFATTFLPLSSKSYIHIQIKIEDYLNEHIFPNIVEPDFVMEELIKAICLLKKKNKSARPDRILTGHPRPPLKATPTDLLLFIILTS